ncbi:small acid-soluble spore protein I (minor) [Pullulanibacillus pueri]|uniref:Small, acid-soluble spore protein I n=1 Tax=Pullulanibacillus pueri TaxID=1437324 RepID=A0A8J2ZZC3_9BACL|nr:small acid-soluble spore protein SspI [Pullulanibacillus pueri]MBM7682021.1 small acid-soluble spore protein I (minor) [Pullulanibacillus pueri]GGH88246.1 small, acid-soluble spore protein I [Pullulanibacillus pueri]
MDINIRNAVKHNISDNDEAQLRDTIVDAIQDGQEKMLPGLGVLFEIIWNESDEQQRKAMINSLAKGV